MTFRIFCFIFSLALLPANLFCAFWLFREALNLAGMTFREFLEKTQSEALTLSSGRHTMRKKQRFLASFFKKYSSDPKKSLRFTMLFGICTLPGLLALCLAGLSAISNTSTGYILTGDIILLVINGAIFLAGKEYKKRNSLNTEKNPPRRLSVKETVVYTLVGALFFAVLAFFASGIFSLTQTSSSESAESFPSAVSVREKLITLLSEKGYETANIQTSFWSIDESKLLHVAAGEKKNSKFEFYGYSDGDTVDLVYNQIVYSTSPELLPKEREEKEVSLKGGGKMFTVKESGTSYVVLHKNDTVIYAYSRHALDEINGILKSIDYIE